MDVAATKIEAGPRKFSPRFEDLENRLLLATNVLTYHYDNARDGANTAETTLTPSNVNSTAFGKEFSLPTDGLVNAQPLLMTGVTIPGQGRATSSTSPPSMTASTPSTPRVTTPHRATSGRTP